MIKIQIFLFKFHLTKFRNNLFTNTTCKHLQQLNDKILYETNIEIILLSELKKLRKFGVYMPKKTNIKSIRNLHRLLYTV